MCLIIRCEQDKELKLHHFKNMYRRNDDGYGFMWVQDNAINGLKRSDATVDELYEKYKELKEFNPVIHLRMRTHGKVNEENAHPYYCGYGIWLMHNGVLHHPSITSNHDMSDTWQFIEQTLNPLFKQTKNPHVLIRTEAFKHLMEGFIGSGNRVVLGDRGGFVYFNENTWFKVPDDIEDIGGLLVSNTYAWDVNEFKKKASNHHHSYYGFRNASGENSYRSGSHWDTRTCEWVRPGVSNVGSTGASNFKHVARGFYMDPWEGVWLWNGYGYSRRRDLDDRADLKDLIEKYEGLVPIQWDTFNPRTNEEATPVFPNEDEDGNFVDASAVLVLPYNATPTIVEGENDNEASEKAVSPTSDPLPEANADEGAGLSEARDGTGDESTDEEPVDQYILDSAEEYVKLEILCRDWASLDLDELEMQFWQNNEEAIKAFYFLLQTMPLD